MIMIGKQAFLGFGELGLGDTVPGDLGNLGKDLLLGFLTL